MIGVVLSLALAAAGAGRASASAPDRASARAFIQDATVFVRASLSRRARLQAAVRGFIAHVASSCPGALAQSPPAIIEHVKGAPPLHGGGEGTPAQQTTSRTLLTLAFGELKVVGYAPIRAPAVAFANELTHLSWTQPDVARAFADLGQSIIATMALRAPDLCAEARASAAVGFAAAPRASTQFANALRATPPGSTLTELTSNLTELANMVRPFLAQRDLSELGRFRRLWARAAPLLKISEASVRRVQQAAYQPRGRGTGTPAAGTGLGLRPRPRGVHDATSA